MSARKTDYRARKDLILGIVVDRYVDTVSPVSSTLIASEYRLDLSPATIRNILAELETEGYLTHPHTSAGRLPTEFGYRYYVDNLMNEIQLLEDEKKRIKHEYDRQILELEGLLEKTSEVISDVTNYTSIISIDGQNDKIFCKGTSFIVEYPETADIGKIRSILSALEEKERILQILNRDLKSKIDIYIGHELACQEIDNCSMVIASYQSDNGPSGRIAVLGPTRMDYKKVKSTVNYFSNLISEMI